MKSPLAHGKVLLAILLLSPALTAAAALELDVKVGLSGHFVPGLLSPVRVSISSETPFSGSLKISQQIGNAWRGEAVIEREIPLRFTGRFEWEETLPIYDFTHPLELSLLDAAEAPLLTKEIALRPGWREHAFPVLAGAFPDPIEPDAVSVDPRELPSFWPAYQAVRSLWLGRLNQVPTREQWTAIAQWVLAGGTLILFTGEEFYRLDTPWLQDLLPLADPYVQQEEDDSYTLRGEQRPGTQILLDTSSGFPLLTSRRYGAGIILLVTRSVFDLSVSDFEAIRAQVPSAELLSLSGPRQTLLEETPLDRPGYMMALLIIVLSSSNLALVTFLPKTAFRTLVLAVAVTTLLALLSGLYTNQTKRVKDIYILNTGLCLSSQFGLSLNYAALFTTRNTPIDLKVREQTSIVQEIPPSLRDHNYDATWKEGAFLSLLLKKHEQRNLIAFAPLSRPPSITRTTDGLVQIKNASNSELSYAFLVVEDVAFPIGPIPIGAEVVPQVEGPGIPLEDVNLQPASVNLLYHGLIERFPFEQGVWLIGGSEKITREQKNQTWQKVRDIELYIVEGGRLEGTD